jgi:His-Xaa-Ser system protein HxsD
LDTFFHRVTVAVLTQGAGVSNEELSFAIHHCESVHSAVLRTAHRFTGQYSVSVESVADHSVVRLIGAVDDPEQVERRFRAALLDDALRARVETETAPLRHLIIEAALRSVLREPEASA